MESLQTFAFTLSYRVFGAVGYLLTIMLEAALCEILFGYEYDAIDFLIGPMKWVWRVQFFVNLDPVQIRILLWICGSTLSKRFRLLIEIEADWNR